MATSDKSSFVWVFPPNSMEPVVAGVLVPSSSHQGFAFRYANSYLARPNCMSLGPDLPLDDRTFSPAFGHGMPSSIRDAMPDSWGRLVVNRELGFDPEDRLPDLRYMLESGSDRVGAIDFQATSDIYLPRAGGGSISEIANGAVEIDSGDRIAPELIRAVRNTLTAAGGSQPKAFVYFEGKYWLAKFQTDYDRRSPLIKAERAALYVADRAGLDVPQARLVTLDDGRLVLLTERFDRSGRGEKLRRRMVISGLTVADEYRVSGASYPKLIEKARPLSPDPTRMGRELFSRLAFRIAMRIDDDHLRNLAFFWDGTHATFTPVFDLSPDLVCAPIGLTDLGDGSREFTLAALVGQHHHYHIQRPQAQEIAERMVAAVIDHRADAAEVAMMSRHEKHLLLTGTATSELRGT